MSIRGSSVILLLALFLGCCAPSRFVKPLPKGKQALALSFGGPAILFSGAPVPVPFTTLCYAKGLSDRISGFGALHLTSSLFGNLQGDAGAVFKLFERKSGLGMSCTPALQAAWSVGQSASFRLWPSLDLNVYYQVPGKASYVYGGLNTWIEFAKYKAHAEPQSRHLIPNFQMGYVWSKSSWQHQIEFKYLGMGIPNLPGVVDYIGIGGKGSIGIYYQVIKTF